MRVAIQAFQVSLTAMVLTITLCVLVPTDALGAERKLVGWLSLSGKVADTPQPFAFITHGGAGISLHKTVEVLESLADNDDYAGVVIQVSGLELSLTDVHELGVAIGRVRDAGRIVLVFAEAYDLPTYLLACSADEILLQHKGEVELTGLAVEELYLVGLFEKIGLKADFLQIGRFKGADEALTRSGPSEAWSENIDALLDDLYAQVIEQIVTTRELTLEQVEAIFADSPSLGDEQLLERRVVDRLVNRDLTEATAEHFGTDFQWDDLAEKKVRDVPETPFALLSMLFQSPKPYARRPTLALMYVAGPITSGESVSGGPGTGLFSSISVGSGSLVRALGEARDDEMVKGVVLRVDSPGGSALASEVIWQAVRELARQKPVFVSIGPMAASGGYYVACAADRIYVDSGAVVGSIGVVGGKITVGGLYEKLGISVHRRSRGPIGDIFNSVDPFTSDQRRLVQAGMDRVYEQFTQRVREGRAERIADISQVAQGRLFTGRQAVANGLADQVGGLEEAISALAVLLNLEEGSYDVVQMPPPLTLPEFLSNLFGGLMVRGPLVYDDPGLTLRQLLGERAWRSAQPVLAGLMLLRHERVLTLFPTVIVTP